MSPEAIRALLRDAQALTAFMAEAADWARDHPPPPSLLRQVMDRRSEEAARQAQETKARIAPRMEPDFGCLFKAHSKSDTQRYWRYWQIEDDGHRYPQCLVPNIDPVDPVEA